MNKSAQKTNMVNLPSSVLEGASGFFTMPIHIVTQRGNQALNIECILEFHKVNQPGPPNVSSGTVGMTMTQTDNETVLLT